MEQRDHFIKSRHLFDFCGRPTECGPLVGPPILTPIGSRGNPRYVDSNAAKPKARDDNGAGTTLWNNNELPAHRGR